MPRSSPPDAPRRTRFELEAPGATRVELLGEVGDWLNPIALTRRDGGPFAVELDLPVGAYAYKLRVDGAWALDPANPRTRSSGGNRNSLLVVGGAAEPLLFAPCAPFVDALDGGGLQVVVGVRRGTAGAPFLRWSEQDGHEAAAALEPAGVEDEHALFRARVPASADRVLFTVGVHDAGADAHAATFAYTRARGELPAWWRDGVVYMIYVDRFRHARDGPGWERDPGRDVLAGGHLDGIRRSLDELADLGASILYLTPVHRGASSHRYDFVDPFTVDPALGGDAAFDALVQDAHARGLRVLLDVSFAHAGAGFPPAADVMRRGRASPHAAWFVFRGDELLHYGRRRDAPLVDLQHPEVQAMAVDAVERWARRGIDGLRLDMAAEVPLDLARAIRRAFLAIRPDGLVLGELVPGHAWRWLRAGALDAATDFGFHGVATDLFARGTDTPEVAVRRLTAGDLARGGAEATRMRFLSTHDHPRFATLAHAAGRDALVPLGLVALATLPGVPALLYGEEIGLYAPRFTPDPENVWEDRAPMPWTPGARDDAAREATRTLLRLRRRSAALTRGELAVLHADDHLLVYRRSRGGDIVDVALNVGGAPAALEIADDEWPALEVLARTGDAEVDAQTVRLGPASALVVRRARAGGRLAASAAHALANQSARDRDFARGAPVTAAFPTRVDFAVTERCNLRCAHCITAAPERTHTGTARTLSPWILDRLRGALGLAGYFGFVHGGESLAAPIFHDVLAAIRDARGGAPTTVHLLTNGVLLGGDATARLVDLGVTSISVSLDGATEATNDAVRVGGRFRAVVRNVEAAARWRRAEGRDLRLGISFVLLESNVGEVGAIVDLAADLGVDWIKLEEAVPVNTFAARSLVRRGREAVAALVADAVARGRGRGLVVVDHTLERSPIRCRLHEDAALRAFVEADEFANRSEIHPCRAAWEVACVEPNGDVRMGDFFGPLLGNVTVEPLAALWNGARAREERRRALAARPCGPDGARVARGGPAADACAVARGVGDR